MQRKYKHILLITFTTITVCCTLLVIALAIKIAFSGLKATLNMVFGVLPPTQVAQTQTPSVTTSGFVYNETSQFYYWRVDPKRYAIDLFWKQDTLQPYYTFASLQQDLARRNKKLLFAMNAGIFATTMEPLGIHVEQGKTYVPLNETSGSGNFYFYPNGVFFITMSGEAGILSTENFGFFMHDKIRSLRLATQSGPMLVWGNTIHPELNATSDSEKIRNGVGITKDGIVYFVLAKRPVNFYTFASFFKKELHCPDALFLDGEISQARYPGGNLQGSGYFVGMIGVTE